MKITTLIILFFVVWLMSMVTIRVIEYTLNSGKRAKRKRRETELRLLQKDKLISFWRTQAETRDI